MVPDEILDEQLAVLSGAELKCLLYIVRRTYGWKKDSDAISLGQMVNGIRSRSGEAVDRGVGLGKSSVAEALASLEADGYILRQRRQTAERGHEATVYSLRMAAP